MSLSNERIMADYNCRDCIITLQIWNAIKNEIENSGYTETYERTLNLYPALLYMMQKGFAVDLDKLAYERSRVTQKVAELQDALNELAGFPINVNSTKDMQGFFYDRLGHKPYTNINTGRPTTDDKALTRLARKPDETTRTAAKLVQEIRNLRKLLTTYLNVTLDKDHRLRCSWNPRGTRFGRLSSSKTILGTGMNMQNLDPRFKGFLVSDPGKVLIEMDKAQAEWVVSAYFFNDENMIEVLETGQDPHTATAMKMTGLSEEMIKREAKILDHATSREDIQRLREEHIPEIFEQAAFVPAIFSCRQGAKKSNHGLNYMMTYKRFALENEMPELDAKRQCAIYHQIYPQLSQGWERYIHEPLRTSRTITNLLGRKYRFIGVLNHDLLKEAVSYVPQSTVADIVNNAIIAAFNDVENIPEFDLRSQTHDSITFEVPRDTETIARVIRRVKQHLEPELHCHGRTFGIGTDAKIGANWGSYNEDHNPLGMYEISINDLTLEDQIDERLKILRH